MESSSEYVNLDVVFVTFFGITHFPIPKVTKAEDIVLDIKDLESQHFQLNLFRCGSKKKVYAEKHCWYTCTLRKHLTANPGKKLRITRWNVKSGVIRAFKHKGKFYHHVVHVCGPKIEDSFYGNPGRSMDTIAECKPLDELSPIRAIINEFKTQQARVVAQIPKFSFLDFAEAIGRMDFCLKDICKKCKDSHDDETLKAHERCTCSIRRHVYAVKNEKGTSKYYSNETLRFEKRNMPIVQF